MDPLKKIKDYEQAMKDAWYIFENRVMKQDHPCTIAFAWRAWFGPCAKRP